MGCENLTTLPESMGNLTQLTELGLMGCESLTTLPESIGKLTQLTELDLRGCEKLTMLPESIQQLTKLDNGSLLSIANIFYREKQYPQAKTYYLKIRQSSFKYGNLLYFFAQIRLALIYAKDKVWENLIQYFQLSNFLFFLTY